MYWSNSLPKVINILRITQLVDTSQRFLTTTMINQFIPCIVMLKSFSISNYKEEVFSTCKRNIQSTIVSKESKIAMIVVSDATVDNYITFLPLKWVNSIYPNIVECQVEILAAVVPFVLNCSNLASIRCNNSNFFFKLSWVFMGKLEQMSYQTHYQINFSMIIPRKMLF